MLAFRIRLFWSSCNCSHDSVFCLKLALFLAIYSLDVAIIQMCFDSMAMERSGFHIPDTLFLTDACMCQLSILHASPVVFPFFWSFSPDFFFKSLPSSVLPSCHFSLLVQFFCKAVNTAVNVCASEGSESIRRSLKLLLMFFRASAATQEGALAVTLRPSFVALSSDEVP